MIPLADRIRALADRPGVVPEAKHLLLLAAEQAESNAPRKIPDLPPVPRPPPQPMPTPTNASPWHPPHELPDSDNTVLLRLDSTPWPVCTGFHDGEFWRHADADKVYLPIKGWMPLSDAARLLDAARP